MQHDRHTHTYKNTLKKHKHIGWRYTLQAQKTGLKNTEKFISLLQHDREMHADKKKIHFKNLAYRMVQVE